MPEKLEAKYGLPHEVKFCKVCVISNQRPNSTVEFNHTKNSKKETINIDENGVCDACKVTELKKAVDWSSREKELLELCKQYKRNDGYYDCISAGSGGKDSFYAAHQLKYKYGMNPLTITWAPHLYTEWGWKNFQSWIGAGFDNYLHTPNSRVHRLLTRLAVENLFHPFQPFIIGQKSFVPKMAVLLNIPLVFYGENEAEHGNPKGDSETPKRDWKYFSVEDKSKIFIGGASIADLKHNYGITDSDLIPYMPANPEDLERIKIDVRYLGYYLQWHPQGAYYYAVEHGGFQPSFERTPGTYSKYNSIDDKIDVRYLGYYLQWHPQGAYYYAVEHGGFQPSFERTPGTYSKYNSIDDKIDDLHYYTTFIKFGIGRATYDASQEIRSGEITREEGVSLVKRFDGEWPARFEDELWKYLSMGKNEFPKAYKAFKHPEMNKDYFMKLADQFRSPHLWKRVGKEQRLRYQVE